MDYLIQDSLRDYIEMVAAFAVIFLASWGLCSMVSLLDRLWSRIRG